MTVYPPRFAAPEYLKNARASRDASDLKFAVALPVLMAFLLGIVPFLGTSAKIPFLITLVPLILWSAFYSTERALYVYIAYVWMDGIIRGVFDLNPVATLARDIIMGVIVLGWGVRRLQSRSEDPLRYPPGTLLIVLFVIDCLLQVFNPYSLGLLSSLAGLKLHLLTIPLLFMGYDVIRRREQVQTLFVFLTLATLVVGLLSLVQYVEGKDWTWAHYPGTKAVISQVVHATQAGNIISANASYKPPGATGFGGNTGTFIGIVFPLTFVLPLLSRKNGYAPPLKAALFTLLGFFVILIFVNGVRSAFVSAFVSIIISGILIGGKLRLRLLLAVFACIILGLIAFTISINLSQGGVVDRFSSTFADPIGTMHKDRHTFFEDAVDIVTRSPLGVGLGRVGPAAGRFGDKGNDLGFTVFSEAYLGQMMFETGVIGGLLISGFALSLALRGYFEMTKLRDPDDKLLATAMVALLVVVFINFFLTPVLIAPPGSVLFWLVGGALTRFLSGSSKQPGGTNS